jgi:hypothetical protein
MLSGAKPAGNIALICFILSGIYYSQVFSKKVPEMDRGSGKNDRIRHRRPFQVTGKLIVKK